MCCHHALSAGIPARWWRQATAAFQCKARLLPPKGQSSLLRHHDGREPGCHRPLRHGPALSAGQRRPAAGGLRRRPVRRDVYGWLCSEIGFREDGGRCRLQARGQQVAHHSHRLEARQHYRQALRHYLEPRKVGLALLDDHVHDGCPSFGPDALAGRQCLVDIHPGDIGALASRAATAAGPHLQHAEHQPQLGLEFVPRVGYAPPDVRFSL
mmetsp:Transcript_15068/g.40623  ORF Transcript_15068/g.40623 Transcript_15068/m.40623 type:complete len:211 (-) Transcript_15068:793-1425(-)